MSDTFLAPSLKDQGYTGATGTTPYKPANEQQLNALRDLYDSPAIGATRQVVPANAVVVNVNFDGTHNNGAFPAPGESPTNIARLSKLQEEANGSKNTIYLPGVGAQKVDSGTLDTNGLPAAGSSPSSWDAIPANAGKEANAIVEDAYRRLTNRVDQILSENPDAVISINLAGFSRGAAQVTALANLLDERGIPGYCAPSECVIDTMVRFEPVDMTRGALNTAEPGNVRNSLVLVALDEGRAIMPAMPVGGNSLVVGVPGAHADGGGSFNQQGISAVTLKAARDFQQASGVPLAEIPLDLQPDWTQMNVHNSGLDNFGNNKWDWSDGARYTEGAGLGAQSVQSILGNGVHVQSTPPNPSAADALDYKIPANPAQPEGEQLTIRETTDRSGRLSVSVMSASGEVLLNASPGSALVRDPQSGVLSVRTEGSNEVRQYDPVTRSVSSTTAAPEFKPDLTQDQADQLQQDLGLKKAPTADPALVIASSGDGVQTDGGPITGYAEGSTSNQPATPAESAPVAIKTEASETEPASGTTPSGAASLNISAATAYAQSMLSAVNLLQALQSGNGLSAALNAAGLANTLGHTFGSGPVVPQNLTGALGALSSTLNLLDSLEHGNTLGALNASLSTGSWVANAMAEHYTSVALQTISEGGMNLAAESAALELSAAGNAMSGAVPFAGMALALQSGNPTSMLAAAANFIPVYGPLISIGISLLGSGGLFGGGATPPPPYGEVHFAWSGVDADGHPHTAIRTDANVSGGAATASQIANQVLHSLQTMVEQANAQTLKDHPDTDPSQLLALNTNLLPSVFWDKDQTSLKLPNPDGVTSFFVNLADADAMSRVIELLQSNGGIAPQWLVETQSQRYEQLLSEGADGQRIERELTAGKSGLTEQGWSQAAAIQGSAGEAADFKTQQFGSLVVHAKEAQVQLTQALKNIDHDDYIEQTQWVAANDAQGHAQSLLIIDFNNDGVVDTRDVLNLGGNRGHTDAKDAQVLNANADLQRNNVQWLDANGDGVLDARDPAFAAVKLYMDINADARVQDSEAQGLAQAGITAIDFTAGEIRYADGHTDALTAQALTGETSGVKLTKVYEVVDGQHVDLQAGDVLEDEGYRGQDAAGAIRQQTFAHEAVRTGDWEGTQTQEAHRHGGTNVEDAPTETTASGAVSQGEFKAQAQTTSQRTVAANQIRQTQTPERLAFVPVGIGLNGIGGLPEARLVTADMVQSMEEGLLGGSGLNLGVLGMLAVGATQAAAQAAEVQNLAPANTSAGLLPGDFSSGGLAAMDGAGTGLTYAMGADGGVVGANQVQSPAFAASAWAGMIPFATSTAEVPLAMAAQTVAQTAAQAGSTSGAPVAATPAQPLLRQAMVTSAPLATTQASNASNAQASVPADAAPLPDAAALPSAPIQGAPATMMLDYPVVRGEMVSGNEDVVFRIPGALLVSNDSTPNEPANPAAPALTVTAVGNAAHGQVALIDGEVVFVPEANFFGTASFMYVATDQYGLSRSATAALQIAAVNDAPTVTGGEAIDSDEDQALVIQAAGLLQNDADVDSPHGELVLSRVQSGTGGTVSLDANGDVTFAPDQDFFGNAVFTYWVRDGAGAESSPVTATVVVAPVNDAPGAQGETVTGASEDAVFSIPKSTLLANDRDVDDPESALRLNWVGNATGGTVSLDADGNVVFTPTVNFNGYASFSYTVRDAAGLVSPVVLASIPVVAVNDAPLGVDDQFATYRDSTMSIGFGQLTSNDTDVDTDALTVSAVRSGANGEVSIVNGKVQFVPTSGFTGAASFDYLADDGQGGQTWATAFVNVIVPPQYPMVNVTLGSYWVDVWHNDAANLRQTFNYSFSDENPATVAMDVVPNFGAGFTYAGFGNVQWVTATDFNIYKYDRYGAANISLNLNLTDESGLTNTAHVYARYSTSLTVVPVSEDITQGLSVTTSVSLTQFSVWHDHTGYATPVVLDLDGTGLQVVATKDSHVAFDVDEDGVNDRMAWVGAGNGVLALDINGDGKISNAKEFVFKQYVEGAQTDLQGLAAFDTNHDGRLDADDQQFAKFGVWQDKNGDGVQDAGEYQTLAQRGIASLDLHSNAQVQGLNSDVVSFGSAQFTRTDGSTGVATDAMFAYQSGTDQAAAALGMAPTPDAASIAMPPPVPASTLGDADAIRMALLFNQLSNTASTHDSAPLGFMPLEVVASGQEWVEAANAPAQQLHAA